jgi:tetraacyldisaccharide 4'-kinase
MNATALDDLMSGRNRRASASLSRAGLLAAVPFYRAAVAVRNTAYDRGAVKPHRLPVPVVSVGNITTGGTGKTPVVIEIVRRLRRKGASPAILLRGYKSRDGQSDEALVLEHELGGDVPMRADPDRVAGFTHVKQQHSDTNMVVLDDGFQHRRVHRNLDIVLIDATNPFGHEHLLPRGLLREPAANLRRADAAIVTRADEVDRDTLAAIDRRVASITGRGPIAHAAHVWSGLLNEHDEPADLTALADLAVAAVCGIGNPGSFKRALKRHAGSIAWFEDNPDHTPYTPAHCERILAAAGNADALVTTEKDWVKLRHGLPMDGKPPIRVYRPVLRIDMLDGSDAIDTLLDQCLAEHDKTTA